MTIPISPINLNIHSATSSGPTTKYITHLDIRPSAICHIVIITITFPAIFWIIKAIYIVEDQRDEAVEATQEGKADQYGGYHEKFFRTGVAMQNLLRDGSGGFRATGGEVECRLLGWGCKSKHLGFVGGGMPQWGATVGAVG